MSHVGDRPIRILVAEDDTVSCRMLEIMLSKGGYHVQTVGDGNAAFQILQADDSPRLAILDWMMPGMDGVDVCRAVRNLPARVPHYLILLTAKTNKQFIVEGLQSGADDYITKPFDRAELTARVQAGCRILDLHQKLTERVQELEFALGQVKQLQGLLPICCYCKKIRDDQHEWEQIDTYLSTHTEAIFNHCICPECMATVVRRELDEANAGGA